MSPLIVALDTDDLDRLVELAAAVGPHVSHCKVGLQAYTAHGPAAVRAVRSHAAVFLDLKLHDIPTTVAGATRAAARLGVDLLTVHAAGGAQMVAAAAKAAPELRILAVTVLTSLDDASLAEVGQPPVAQQVPRLAALAVEAGAAGVVCAPSDVAAVRGAVGHDALIVTPGIRPIDTRSGSARRDDQARVGTPRDALGAGATHLVVGRPVTQAAEPAAAARDLVREASR